MSLDTVCLQEVEEARSRLRTSIRKTPLVPLNNGETDSQTKIFLKLENLHPIGSFKIRGACNAVELLPKAKLQSGVYTASAGNFSQGLAWNAQRLGVPCEIIVPEHAPRAKLEPTERLGGKVTRVAYDRWWQVIMEHHYEDASGTFIHPVCDRAVIAGNGTIGLEILEDLQEVDSIIVPYGGGGLSSGIALTVKAIRPQTKVYAVEVDTAAPLSAALAAGKPVPCSYTPTFVDGMGSKSVLDEMWPLVSKVLDGSIVVSLEDIANAVRLLAERNHVIAEGAGAAAVAAALTGRAGEGNIVCIISGGNIDIDVLINILQGKTP
ncbi:L-threonine ammonia-lyase-like [Haliotis rufescens]|uniref:L-threonine ammonia-lyase-like n=1 Tax=Haliotis rufescens TaxID=6454 RepID=UPI001EB074E2|nr:L-threonine ammonia-lyase-like [Haliotis rufescens]